jgi:hypothetical protein
MTDNENPENEEHRLCVREACMAVHVVLERELGTDLDIVLLARPKGSKRSYFCTNTPEAEDMMRSLLEHLPHAIAEIRAHTKERPN